MIFLFLGHHGKCGYVSGKALLDVSLDVGCDFLLMLSTERVHLCYLSMLCVTTSAKLLPSYKNNIPLH